MHLNAVIVDDSEINLLLFKALAERQEEVGVHCFLSSEEALAWCAGGQADLVVVDYMMPAPDGLEFIRRFRAMPGMLDVPVTMVTASNQLDVRYSALQLGASDFLTKPIDKTEFVARFGVMCKLRRGQRQLADRAAWLAEEVSKATRELIVRERESLLCLAKAAEFRDPETGAHIMRMSHYAELIARRLGLSAADQQRVLEAAPMHDVGKVGTPDMVLLKPGPLTAEERAVMCLHAEQGHEILSRAHSPVLQVAAEIALSHHEKWDGSGYPRGLAGENIPLFGRIVAVADVFDALTSPRPYKKAWPLDAARSFIIEQRGLHFDPACVDAFLGAWDEVLAIRARFPDEGEALAAQPAAVCPD